MPDETLYIENLDKLLDVLANKAPREFHNAAVKGMKIASTDVTGWVKQNSPVDTGRMRSSFHSQVVATFGNVQGIIGTEVKPYPAILEQSNKKPRGVGRIPFLRPAVEEHKGDTMATFEKAFREVARRLGF